MEECRSNRAEINSLFIAFKISSVLNTSIAYSDKKRKLGDEQLETPLPKHIRTDSNTEAKKELARGFESEPESTISNSINNYSDAMMFTDPESPNTYSSNSHSSLAATSSEPLYSSEMSSTFSSLADATSSEALYSLEITSSTISSRSEPESLSINLDFSFDHQCIEKEIENILYSNGIAPSSNFILSSKRWSVNQDSQQESKKLTIDKEFEQYFSKLVL